MALENMRTMLRGNLGRSLNALSDEDRLAAAWPVACGRAMAEHGEIVALFEGTLTVEVSDAAWLSQMLSMRSILQNELARIAQVKVTAIHFELKKR
ncbi:putative nucleic acid-binding Zn ribbon protein [Granulicella aggregans]|uniref:Putative nucleic acid-binding Zn ribbon protein n=1 Tax=Granulicella aggregans TaxID=474949 RepID=A0A7W7ZEQ0_9BACT|nr:DciA family protein [Granulicella aggregans]MBB5058524.1 putative nucleic acid-binding Zn ribbon protein [Granulicella aggregans]